MLYSRWEFWLSHWCWELSHKLLKNMWWCRRCRRKNCWCWEEFVKPFLLPMSLSVPWAMSWMWLSSTSYAASFRLNPCITRYAGVGANYIICKVVLTSLLLKWNQLLLLFQIATFVSPREGHFTGFVSVMDASRVNTFEEAMPLTALNTTFAW